MMRRVVGTAVIVGVVVVLAAPAVRRGLGARLDAVTGAVRGRLETFRTDYATREADLRRQLLPTEEQHAQAEQHRAADR